LGEGSIAPTEPTADDMAEGEGRVPIRANRRGRAAQDGLAVLQILIVFAIAAVVAGIGIPVYASRAKDVVLEQNMVNLAQQMQRVIVQDEGSSMTDDTSGADVSSALGSSEAGRYMNPVSGSAEIVSQPSPPKAGAAAPAIWITTDPEYAHDVFAATLSSNDSLAGTLLVVLAARGDGTATTVYFVDRQGHCSDRVETLSSF
jgi:Tfp pilus assembly protein PilE